MIDIVTCLGWIVGDCAARRDLEVAEALVHPRRPTEEYGDVFICRVDSCKRAFAQFYKKWRDAGLGF
jgi:hypothetical protein